MGASLTEQRRVRDDALRGVNRFSRGRGVTVPEEEGPANYVPAAAVIRRGRALSGVTGRKARAGGSRARRESPRLNRGESSGTAELEGGRGRWNSRCSGEMRRDREEHPWRRRPTGPTLTLRREGVGSERD